MLPNMLWRTSSEPASAAPENVLCPQWRCRSSSTQFCRSMCRQFGAQHLEHQEAAFERMLLEILEHLEDGAWLQLHLFALGTRHTDWYKVPRDPAPYGWVGFALPATLEAATPGWD